MMPSAMKSEVVDRVAPFTQNGFPSSRANGTLGVCRWSGKKNECLVVRRSTRSARALAAIRQRTDASIFTTVHDLEDLSGRADVFLIGMICTIQLTFSGGSCTGCTI